MSDEGSRDVVSKMM